ncbi:hypothetical protein BC792_101293 [Sphingobacterium allocomposti]|uniref:Uncharacterized protein n=1 Tax=Sphingobacterium allocomposti TaxID=415956 RepID=A0A5S5DS89_9SPHI|nr:hypothetical protein BC792_101293 [Sphingobacterium composti Yoo et al. 2007 non Ten et al. 2007]
MTEKAMSAKEQPSADGCRLLFASKLNNTIELFRFQGHNR